MISQYLTSIQGIEIVGVTGLLLSIAGFAALTFRALRAGPAYLRRMERLPLHDSSDLTDEAAQ